MLITKKPLGMGCK